MDNGASGMKLDKSARGELNGKFGIRRVVTYNRIDKIAIACTFFYKESATFEATDGGNSLPATGSN